MKTAVVYWSGTGNTEAMARAVAEGMTAAGAEAVLLTPRRGRARRSERLRRHRLRLPPPWAPRCWRKWSSSPCSMPASVALAAKRVALFGSYGWGDGEVDAYLGE